MLVVGESLFGALKGCGSSRVEENPQRIVEISEKVTSLYNVTMLYLKQTLI